MKASIRKEARELATRIARFNWKCEADEYTDTDEANDLLTEAKDLLRRIGSGRLTVRPK